MLSVITLVRNRNDMLQNLMSSLEMQTDAQLELVVVHAGGEEDPHEVVDGSTLSTTVVTPGHTSDDVGTIAYSRARNAGARASGGDHLLFADADTILGPESVQALSDALLDVDALATGELRYLPPGHPTVDEVGFARLCATARPHPARPRVPASGVALGDDHDLVWGLNMAMRRSTFERTGGYDERYRGYAGEDTDLARVLRHAGVRTAVVAGAVVLHQHHDSFDPPLQQFRATLDNARLFHAKWDSWPMGGWLDGFERLGLIEWIAGDIRILRDPTDEEIESSRCTCAAPFRTSTGAITGPPVGT